MPPRLQLKTLAFTALLAAVAAEQQATVNWYSDTSCGGIDTTLETPSGLCNLVPNTGGNSTDTTNSFVVTCNSSNDVSTLAA